ncbi:hemicentin-1-like isoform X2 [Mizuhopecten yessoensis]|uniref:Hemicentin-1 n=1 Tax=Mizuhopecten yessoensis TaxID=6573 RepID=A0A210Q164_MIZYE|nr:hemicentin-1-like isoform X2 [Mizuhopecten yessoensis]OWF42445.1 Hemicentin-1 [Mizuhopecten yessoensis]
MAFANSKMCIFFALFGVLLTVDLAVSQANMPGDPVITNFVPKPTLNTVMTLTCTSAAASSSVPQITIQWLLNDNFLGGDVQSTANLVTTSTIAIPITARDMVNDEIKCEAVNSVGRTETSVIIVDVQQKPTVTAITPAAAFFDTGTMGTWTLNISDAYPGLILSTTPRWYIDDTQTFQFSTSTSVDAVAKTYSYTSTLTRSLNPSDHNLIIKCEIDHPTFDSGIETRFRSMIVRYPPGHPQITTNFINGVNENTILEGNCSSRGGYPTPIVAWSGTAFDVTSSYTSGSDLYVTQFRLTAVVGLIGQTFTCTTQNAVGTYSATATLPQVFVQPAVPSLAGPSEVYEGTAVNFTCKATRTNPAASLFWLISTTPMAASYPVTSSTNGDGTTRTSSTINIVPTAQLNATVLTCEAAHVTLPSNLKTSITIIVRLKPSIVLASPSSENVLIASVHSIDCDVTSSIEFNITWWHVSLSGVTQMLTAVNSKYIMWTKTSTIRTLSIQNYQSSDDGSYYAIAANQAGLSPPSAIARTTGYAIPVKPFINLDTFNFYPVVGANVVMNCSSTGGVPITMIKWYRNNVAVDTTSITSNVNGVDVTYNEYTRSVVFDDKGAIFKCEASNAFGNTSSVTSFVDVYVTPSIPVITGVDAVLENHTYSWICSTFASNPVAMVSWTYGGENVTSQARITQESNSQKAGTFNVNSNLTLHIDKADAGKILTCFVNHVTLPVSPLSTNHPLNVYLIPTAYVAEQNKEAEIGKISVLTCNVDTQLTATVTWYKTGSTLPLQHNQVNYVINDRTLTFNPVIREHEGSYMCSAENDAGSSGLSAAVGFTVYQLPSVPVITMFPVTGIEGELSIINATSSGGYPVPTLTWTRSGVVVYDTSTTVGSTTYNNYFFVTSLSDIGVPYTATVSNAYGNFSTSNALTDVYVPASPPGIEGASVAYEGTPITHRCSSARARPAPALSWFLGDADLTSQATQTSVNHPDLLTVRTASNLTFTPTQSDIGKVLTCVLHQPDGRDSDLSVVLPLNVYLKPRVTMEPATTDVEIGTNKILRCVVQSVLDPTVLWFIDDSAISFSDDNYVMSGEYLTILDFATTDNGAYSCIGQNEAGLSSQSDQLTLTAYASPGSPSIVMTPSSVPSENDTVVLTCNTENGVPSPNITWSKNGVRLYNGITTSVTTTSVSSTLTFVVNYVNDTGAVYRCTTANSFGTRFTTATIPLIYVPPTVDGITIQGSNILYESQTSHFYCENSRSFPAASISWVLNGETLTGQSSESTNADGTFKVSSNLTHQARYSDSGSMNLVCRVSHSATASSADKMMLLIGYSIPRVSITIPSVTVEKGTSLTLHCVIVSELGQAVAWYRSNTGQTLTPPGRYNFNGPNVTIMAVEVSDEGGYYCTASNTAGISNNSNSVMVTVYAYPVKPVITGLGNAVPENTELTINCTAADGYPLPTIMWFRDGNLILTASSGLHSSYSFIADFSVRESEYTCSATNSYGSEMSDATTIPDVYVPHTGIQLTGPAAVYETKMSVFLCTVARVSPVPTFRWLIGTTVISSSNVTELGDNLQISSYFSHVFEASDLGKNITSIVTQVETSTAVSKSLSVTLHLLPKILNIADNRDVELFTITTVICEVSSSDPSYSVAWYKGGILIDVDTSNGKFSTSSNLLTITSFQVEDSGLYTCSASHQGGSSGIGQPTNLTGFGYPIQPVITTSHPAMILIEGETLFLNASTNRGVPVPTLIWKRSRPGSANEVLDSSYTSTMDGSNTFVFNNYSAVIHFRDNGSVYICEAENQHLKVVNSIQLRDVYVTPVPTLSASVVNWDQVNSVATVYEDKMYTFNGSIPRFNPKTAVIRWFVDNVEKTPNYVNQKVTATGEHKYTSSINVLMPSSLDGKNVTFMVVHPETTSRNVSITIDVLHKPRVSVQSASGLVVKDTDFSVTCEVVSTLSYNVEWKIQGNDTKLENTLKYRITGGQGQTLMILSADYTDKVTYACSATNSAGTSDMPATFFLVVYKGVGQPALGGLNRNVIDGETVTVHCNSSGGDPPASIAWEKNGVALTAPNPTFGNSDNNPVSSMLMIVVNFATDKNAVYKCTASNAYSSLSVESRFSDVYIFSNTISLTNLGIVTALTQYTVGCQTSGMYLEPRPVWMLNNVIQSNGITSVYSTASDGTFAVQSNLTFIPTRDNNGGNLVCKFDHTQYTGRSVNATQTLFVQFSPDEPIISGFNPEVTENTPQSLLCTVNSGNPRPTVRWFKNNNLIMGTEVKISTNTQGHYVTTNRLNFTASLQDDSSATYTCHFQHVVRNSTSNVTFGQIKAPPSNIFLTLPTETLTASQPRISNYPNLIAGKVYEWNGTVGRAQPAPSLAWRRGNIYLNSHTSDTTDNVDETVRTVSTLRYAPTVADNDIDLTFEVFHLATSQQTSSHTTKLIIHGPPVVIISPDSVDIIVDSSHTAQCNVTSSLNSYTVKWFKGVSEISSNDKYSLIGNNLVILSVQFADEGEYRCLATNAAGDSAKSNAVTVSAISGAGEPAITGFVSSPKEGDVLQLLCTSVGGVPTPSVIWKKNNVVQDDTDSSSTIGGVTTTINLWIYTVSFADRGASLTCLATNSVANKTRTKTFDDVYIPPINGASSIQGLTTTLAGSTYNYTLNFARVHPAPGVLWSVGGRLLQANVPPISAVVTTGGFLNATASITILQLAEDNLEMLKASVSHPETSTTFDVVTTLTVKSPPSQPSISGFPSTNTSIKGTTLQLVCTTKGGYPVPTLQWYRNNALVGNGASTDFSVEPTVTTVTYTLAVVLAEKGAVFRCTAKNEINELSKEVGLKDVYVRVEVDGGISGDSNVIAGKNTTLTCTTTPSYPQPTVEWWMAAERLLGNKLTPGTSDSNGAIIVRSDVYFVPDQADTGKTVSCIVKQDMLPHTASASLLITVHGPPSANAHPNKNVTLNEHVTFTCSVTSTLPTYNVTWYKRTSNTEGTRITSVNEKYAVDDNHPVYKLWVYSVVVSDNGIYYCIAQSAAGNSSRAEVSLTVYTAPSKPSFYGGLTSLTIAENSKIEATCVTTVHPANTASFTWFYVGTTGETEVDDSFVNANVLNIPSADRTKAGTYVCQTFNSFGSSRANFTVDIQYPPRLNVGNVQTDFSATAEDLVKLSCNVIANPPPTAYLWTHENNNVATTKDLEVKVKAGEHTYTCVATNEMGPSQGIIYTVVAPQVTLPDTGASTADVEGLSGGVIAAIVLGVIFIIIILIICCVGCKYYKDKTKDDKVMRTTKKSKTKHKPSSVVPDTDDRRSTLYPSKEKDPAYLFGPTRPSYRAEQRHYPREISAHDYHHDYSQRGGYDNTFYIPAPGSEMDDMSVFRETGFRSRRQRLPHALPPLATASYTREAKRRKNQRKKNQKKRQQKRQAGEGMENPAKSKDTSPQIVIDDSQPEKDAAQDTNILLGDQFK